MADESLILKLPGAGGAELDLTGGSPWYAREVVIGAPGQRDEWVSGVDTEGAAPARVFRRDNRDVTFTLRLRERAVSSDAAMDQVAALNQAIEEAKRVAARGVIDPAVDSVRLIWTPHGSSRTFVLPVVGGTPVELPLTNQGEDSGWFKDQPVVRVQLVCGPFGYGADEVLVSADTDSGLIADGSVAVVDLPAVGGDVPPWVDLELTEADSTVRNLVLVTAESPATSDSDWVPATDFVLTGYAGSLAGGTVTASSSDWQYLAEIPAQSHSRPRRVFAVSGGLDGELRLTWRAGGTARENDPGSFGYAGGHADLGVVQGDWTGVLESRGSVATTGLVAVGADGHLLARSALAAGGVVKGRETHRDDFSASGTLNGKSLDLGGTWATSGATTDWSNSSNAAQRTTTSDSSARIGLAGSQTPSWVWASLDISVGNSAAWPNGSGLLLRYVDTSNFVFVGVSEPQTVGFLTFQRVRVGVVVSGSMAWIDDGGGLAILGFWPTRINVRISDDGTFILRGWHDFGQGWSYAGEKTGFHPALNVDGALNDGRVGIYDRWSGAANTRKLSNFVVMDTPWRPDPLLPEGGDLRLVGDTLLHDLGGERSYRGNGLTELHPAFPARLFVGASARHDRLSVTDDLGVQVRARPRFLTVPS